jgi:hypothetical protein
MRYGFLIIAIPMRTSSAAAMLATAFAYEGRELSAKSSAHPTHASLMLKSVYRHRYTIQSIMHGMCL